MKEDGGTLLRGIPLWNFTERESMETLSLQLLGNLQELWILDLGVR